MQLPRGVKEAAFEAAYEASHGMEKNRLNHILKAAFEAIEDHPEMNREVNHDYDPAAKTRVMNVFEQDDPGS